MKRRFSIMLKLLPVSLWLLAGPCGITDRQFVNFASSTVIRVIVTTAASVLESSIIAGQS